MVDKMVDKIFYKNVLQNMFSDPCTVTFWDGETITYGEGNTAFHITFHKPISKQAIMDDATLAFGEAYMNGILDIEGNIEQVILSMYNNKDSFLGNHEITMAFLQKLKGLKKQKKAKEEIQFHYDIGNDFYQLWLDDTMTYSCAYFKNEEDSLTTAQKNKVQHILKKLNLQQGNTLLDIGCGWGELILTAAKQYGVKALGITLSAEQFAKVKQRIADEKMEDLVEVELLDYHEIKDRTFDRIVSVGMIEHVGQEQIPEYFETVSRLLNPGGISVVHSITSPNKGATNSWLNKYIFPGGYSPGISELIENITTRGFFIVDVESLRRHYSKTLETWASNFESNLPIISQTKDEVFIRMWRLYLNACAAAFKCGNIDLHQIIFTKGITDDIPWTREYMYQ